MMSRFLSLPDVTLGQIADLIAAVERASGSRVASSTSEIREALDLLRPHTDNGDGYYTRAFLGALVYLPPKNAPVGRKERSAMLAAVTGSHGPTTGGRKTSSVHQRGWPSGAGRDVAESDRLHAMDGPGGRRLTALERAFAYANGLHVKAVDKQSLGLLLRRGLLPSVQLGQPPSFVSERLCVTVIPDGPDPRARSTMAATFNCYYDALLAPAHSPYRAATGNIRVAFLFDLRRALCLPDVGRAEVAGSFSRSYYPRPTFVVPFDESAHNRGFSGEARLPFNDPQSPELRGVPQQVWRGLVVHRDDLATLKRWLAELRASGLEMGKVPIFDQDLQPLGTLALLAA
ncbi:MAG: hypothetical protein HY903_07925 [Deltaproteobacteria bacterium]|nr:hypothetical protein [Deltaproteobacteria bacterium]